MQKCKRQQVSELKQSQLFESPDAYACECHSIDQVWQKCDFQQLSACTSVGTLLMVIVIAWCSLFYIQIYWCVQQVIKFVILRKKACVITWQYTGALFEQVQVCFGQFDLPFLPIKKSNYVKVELWNLFTHTQIQTCLEKKSNYAKVELWRFELSKMDL